MRRLIVFTLVVIAGCEESRGDPPAAPQSDAGSERDADVKEAGGPGVVGTLRDPAGHPLGDAAMSACMATLCLSGKTDSDGRFFFAIEAPAVAALKTSEDLSKSPRRAVTLFPLQVAGSSRIDVGSVYVPDLPEGVRIRAATEDPQTLAVGDGLELTLRRADLEPRFGGELFDIAARAIPRERRPPLEELGGEEVLAVYALHPFGASSQTPIGVRVPSDLPSGTPVQFRTISELDGRLSEPAPGHADGNVLTTDPSHGIREVTWIVISK